MASGPALGGDTPADQRAGGQMFGGWNHLQRALGGSLPAAVKRSRKLARANLRRKR